MKENKKEVKYITDSSIEAGDIIKVRDFEIKDMLFQAVKADWTCSNCVFNKSNYDNNEIETLVCFKKVCSHFTIYCQGNRDKTKNKYGLNFRVYHSM